MEISELKGLTLEAVRVSKSSYTLELCGMKDGAYKNFELSTSFSFGDADLFEDTLKNFSSIVVVQM